MSILDRIIGGPEDEWWKRYSAYLRSDRWKEKRARCLERAQFKCKKCGGKATQAHHLTYVRMGRERQSDLLAVCKVCHEEIHGRRLR
jgi:5-methylcytosine-specific restriction endonuclease McrA